MCAQPRPSRRDGPGQASLTVESRALLPAGTRRRFSVPKYGSEEARPKRLSRDHATIPTATSRNAGGPAYFSTATTFMSMPAITNGNTGPSRTAAAKIDQCAQVGRALMALQRENIDRAVL